MKHRLSYMTLFLAIFPTIFAAESEQAPATVDLKYVPLQTGIGFAIVDNAQKGADTDLYVMPLLIDAKHHLFVFGTNIRYVLFYEDGWMFSAAGSGRLEGYKNSESTRLNGMRNRHDTYELGVSLSKEFSWGKLEGLFLADILDEHRGQEFRLTCSKSFADVLNINSLKLTPSVGFNWRSHQLNDYYYGVKADETIAGRPAYQVGSATNIITGLRADYTLNDKWNLFGTVNIEWLNSEISDSPLADKDYLLSFFVGTLYTF